MKMELENPADGENRKSEDACNGDGSDPPHSSSCFTDDIDSTCSTPYVSAPSSPGRSGPSGYFYSAPASPMHFVLSSSPYCCAGANDANAAADGLMSGSFEFEFSARFGGTGSGSGAAAAGSMISADELFLNGQIRPMNLSSHLQRPQVLAPLLDLEGEEDEDGSDRNEAPTLRGRDLKMRNRSLRRRARSMSPLRNATPFQWHDDGEDLDERSGKRSGAGKSEDVDLEAEPDHMDQLAAAATPSVSASSSRSSSTSSSRSSKRWVFLKDLLYRSKSEGRGNTKDKFWNALSFSPSKDRTSSLFFRDRFTKPPPAPGAPPSTTAAVASAAPSEAHKPKQKNAGSSSSASTSKKPSSTSSKPANGVGKRRVPSRSPHERHYTANRAQAEEMRKKTFLPYRQGLLGCLWFSSRSYGAMNGLARTLNPVSSR
ncbi:hypothetical protein Taro_031841 [Colocasia esculenta]|uniref:Uncharacterized protein n=1 Tax=Colocasia esculenta TaxID=4460 RepID=A0A843W7L4_COLES|nr:hypothetical protein [Colocasia esculenta]